MSQLKQFSAFLLLFSLFFSTASQAKVLDAHAQNNSGALKQYDLKTAQAMMQEELIRQITVTNIIKNSTPYKVSVEAGRRGGVNVHALQRRFAPQRSRLGRPAPRPVARGASSTNLREKGVDEADFVKTDGRYLFSLSTQGKGRGLRIYDTRFQGKKLKQVATLGFDKRLQVKGMYLLAPQQKLVIVTESYQNLIKRKNWGGNTRLIFIDIRNKNQPRVIRKVNLEGTSRSTNRIGNQLYVVLNTYSFQLPATNKTIQSNKPITQQQFDNEKQRLINGIKAWRIDKQLPHYLELGKSGTHNLINSNKFYLSIDDIRSFSLTSIIAIDLNAARFSYNGVAYFGSPETVYVSPKSIYLSSHYNDMKTRLLDRNRFPLHTEKTQIHKFSLRGRQINFRGSGVILGNLGWGGMSTFQLDEDARGNLRVVSQNWNAANKKNKSNDPATRSPVIITALAEQGGKLVMQSRLPNRYYPTALGKKNEQLRGVRLFDDYAYFVTFRRVDPLYVIDMRNPRSMKIAGKLVIPGFSDYLHPIGNHLLLGIGKEVEVLKNGRAGRTKGLKLSLFDIRNPARPKEISKIVVGDSHSETPATREHHALTTLKVGNTGITRVLLPANLHFEKTQRYDSALQRFEINSRTKTIKHIGEIKPHRKKKSSNWYWSYGDRSIMIGERVFYYHNGQFQEAPWHSQQMQKTSQSKKIKTG